MAGPAPAARQMALTFRRSEVCLRRRASSAVKSAYGAKTGGRGKTRFYPGRANPPAPALRAPLGIWADEFPAILPFRPPAHSLIRRGLRRTTAIGRWARPSREGVAAARRTRRKFIRHVFTTHLHGVARGRDNSENGGNLPGLQCLGYPCVMAPHRLNLRNGVAFYRDRKAGSSSSPDPFRARTTDRPPTDPR